MSDRDRHLPNEDEPPESAEPSRDAITPRGGFMARPGLKLPPRHAVVVRLGDAPATEEIPLARGSKPPPEPVPALLGDPSPEDDKVTLRAIPTPSAPRAAQQPIEPLPPVMDSVPPPSDMPVVASVRPPSSSRSAGSRKSSKTIGLAAAAGLVLGLGSVAINRLGQGEAGAPVAAGALEQQRALAEAESQRERTLAATPLASTPPAPSQSAVPATAGQALPEATPASPKAARRSIF